MACKMIQIISEGLQTEQMQPGRVTHGLYTPEVCLLFCVQGSEGRQSKQVSNVTK